MTRRGQDLEKSPWSEDLALVVGLLVLMVAALSLGLDLVTRIFT